MKTLRYITLLAAAIGLTALNSCNDFLNESPKTQMSPEVVFSDYASFQMYTWGLYDVFGLSNFSRHIAQNEGPLDGDAYAYLSICVPPNDNNPYNLGTYDTNNAVGWNQHFDYLRRVNTMLDVLDNHKGEFPDVTANDAERAHWRSVGYFFRAWVYADLLSKFGDVPVVLHKLAENEAFEMNVRVPRDEVSRRIIDDLIYARDNIEGSGTPFNDGKNTIDRNCVLALLSRLTLQEATTRIYRGTDYSSTEADPIDRTDAVNVEYLRLCVEASEELMNEFPTLAPWFDELFTADKGLYGGSGLDGYPGVILYKAFAQGIAIHNHTKNQMSNSGKYQVNKQIVEMFLCRNGRPVTGNEMYLGDASMFDEFSGRDRRLRLSVVPPYHVNDNTDEANHVHFDVPATNLGMLSKGLDYYRSRNADHNVYIDSVAMVSRRFMKMLPCTNWSGNVVPNMPNLYYAKTPDGMNGTGTIGYVYSNNGYTVWKYVNTWTDVSSARNFNDIPILHVEEAMLNYAEAKWELGEFDQAVADRTVNMLRGRDNIRTSPMQVGEIDASFDPARDPEVDPVLWEIRRERIMELLGEGFGFDDIRRWGTAEWFVAGEQRGCGVTLTEATPSGGVSYGLEPGIYLRDFDGSGGYSVGVAGQSGYIFVDTKRSPGWDDKYYLEAIPYTELRLDESMRQNPGYSE